MEKWLLGHSSWKGCLFCIQYTERINWLREIDKEEEKEDKKQKGKEKEQKQTHTHFPRWERRVCEYSIIMGKGIFPSTQGLTDSYCKSPHCCLAWNFTFRCTVLMHLLHKGTWYLQSLKWFYALVLAFIIWNNYFFSCQTTHDNACWCTINIVV